MQPFTTHHGTVVAMDRANVDTDQIIPKQFLKRIERTGFGQFLFFDWRFHDDGSPRADFELNQAAARKASILLARENFGSGSSREHAVWALADYGFRALIAPSFADIFYNNCFKNGVLPVALPIEEVNALFERAAGPPFELTVDLERQVVEGPDGWSAPFQVDPSRRERMLQGLDDIGLTLQHEAKITEFERRHPLPSLA